MAYSAGMVQQLTAWLGNLVPPAGSLLDLGEQTINPDVPPETIHALLVKTGGGPLGEKRRVADAFEGSRYFYRCIDLTKGSAVITADLNLWRVPWRWRRTFDLILNLGTSEHVTDQVNLFRAVHDLTKTGGTMLHSVPFTGYFGHGLYNYHPQFFILLAHANGYELQLALSQPHLPYTLPTIAGISGSERWAGIRHESGMITARMRKVNDRPFRLFTDYDIEQLGRPNLPMPWAQVMLDRNDLRVR